MNDSSAVPPTAPSTASTDCPPDVAPADRLEGTFRAAHGELLGTLFYLVGNLEDAHDALQETFVKVYRKLDQFDLNRTFGPWFFQVLRNQCRDMLRSRKARAKHIGHDERLEERPAGERWDPDRHMERTDAKRILWEGLDRVGEEHREILVLKELEDFRYHEIARILEIPEGTVASRLYHARRALRDELEELGYAGVGS